MKPMTQFSFTVPGKPKAWQRARSNGARRFESPEQRAHKDAVATLAKAEWQGGPTENKCLLHVSAWFQRPKSHYRTGRFANELNSIAPYPSDYRQKPDADNIAKLIMDALEGVVWRNDTQVDIGGVGRYWVENDERTIVAITVLGDDE